MLPELPIVDPDNARLLDGLRAGKIRIQAGSVTDNSISLDPASPSYLSEMHAQTASGLFLVNGDQITARIRSVDATLTDDGREVVEVARHVADVLNGVITRLNAVLSGQDERYLDAVIPNDAEARERLWNAELARRRIALDGEASVYRHEAIGCVPLSEDLYIGAMVQITKQADRLRAELALIDVYVGDEEAAY